MNAADIIGHTADADTWCLGCTAKLYPESIVEEIEETNHES